MAKVRMIGPRPRAVPWLGAQRVVQPDEVVEVDDSHFESFVCQPQIWQAVEEPKEPAPAKTPAKASAKTTTKGD